MSKRLAWLIAAALTGALVLAGGAGGATSLPTLNVALTGTKGISVSGSAVSGAVNVSTTFSGKGQGFVGLVRLDPGVSVSQAFQAVQSHHGDLNALTPYGALMLSGAAPSTIQTVLTAGDYVALNTTGNGQPGFQVFTVAASPSPAPLPAASATQSAIEFGFRGPTVLHNGSVVRAQNTGYLVHMIDLIGVRRAATGRKVIALLRAGRDRKAMKLASNRFVSLLGPASPGALQQQVLSTHPGYYVEACFMNTQDGREHTRLGMLRLVRVAK